MELRVLKYFLAVAREENFSKAAESLHLSQPTLSRQIQDFEDELGKKLLIRGKRKITLTDEGMLLRRRAQEIVDLTEKTEAEIKQSDEFISGNVYIGGGETEGMRLIANTAKFLQEDYPQIKFHLFSGVADDVTERLDKGLLDFGVVIELTEIIKYNSIKLPVSVTRGVLMRKDSPFAARDVVTPDDLLQMPLIVSPHAAVPNLYSNWTGGRFDKLNVVATFNLLFNAALMVEEGVGNAICIDGLYTESGDSPLCFRRLEPKVENGLVMVWKKYQIFSKAAEKFLQKLQEEINIIKYELS